MSQLSVARQRTRSSKGRTGWDRAWPEWCRVACCQHEAVSLKGYGVVHQGIRRQHMHGQAKYGSEEVCDCAHAIAGMLQGNGNNRGAARECRQVPT
ncbi:hypothetical protein GOP47_0004823 [Adiantum capillus-veneris]|uniref:Uncharacterized protein n=1 Tax=Adiantum capillus-veneris TaxID=13818 RepID=A0A9D4ZL00_ADICA|nr:hypothetical protein GOP47_0004823 [Adiantum capillus-veneris]